MIDDKIKQAFNDQIKYEAESAYLYFAMSAWFQERSLDGMAQWMRSQAVEEMGHAQRFMDHILDRGGAVTMQPLGIKKTRWETPLEAFKDALEHERFISGKIDELVGLSDETRDRPARTFLEWFVDEQVEEESSVSRIVDNLELVGEHGHGVLMLDRELSQRQVTIPTTGEEGA
jgi:ferritin